MNIDRTRRRRMDARLDTAVVEVLLHRDVIVVTTPNDYLTNELPVGLQELVVDPICGGGRRSWEALVALAEAPSQLAFPTGVSWPEVTCVS
jgi:hypothetical protein